MAGERDGLVQRGDHGRRRRGVGDPLRARIALVVTGMVALVLAGCQGAGTAESGSTEAESVELRVAIWSSDEAHLEMLNGFADDYRQVNPNVSVEFVPTPISDYLTKVTVQLAGGNPPDVGWLGEGDVRTMVEAGALVDLAPTLNAVEDYDLADFVDAAMESWVDGEAIYGIPFSTSPFVIYYNRDLVDAAGVPSPDELAENGEWTWEKLAEVAASIAEAAPAGTYGFQGQDGGFYEAPVNFWNTILPTIRAYGGEPWDVASGECLLGSPESAAAMELYHQMIYEDESMIPPGEQADFFSGQAGLTINQLSRASALAEAPFEWGIAPLPHGPAGQAVTYGQAGLVAFQASNHPEEAADFVAFVTSKENVATMAQFFPPVRISVLNSDEFLTGNPLVEPDDMRMIAGAVETAQPFPFVAEGQDLNLSIQPVLDELWRPGADVPAVLADVCAAAEPYLAQQG